MNTKKIKVPKGVFFIEAIDNEIRKEKFIDISDKKMIRILVDIAKIEDKELRLSLIEKLGL